MSSNVRAYPYERWPRFHKRDQLWLRGVVRALPRRFDRAQSELAALLGATVELRMAAAEVWPVERARGALLAPLVVVSLELRVGAEAFPLLCEIAPERAASLVDRVLGGDGRAAHVAGDALDDLSAGVLGYLAARVCATAGAEVRVCAVTIDPAAARAALTGRRALVWPLHLRVAGTDQGSVRIFVAEATGDRLASLPIGPLEGLPIALRTLQLPLCAHLARVVVRRSQLCELEPGAAIVPQRSGLQRSGLGFSGHVELHVIGSRRHAWRCAARADELVLEAIEALCEENSVSETKRIHEAESPPSDSVDTLAGDAPVELCLELARFTLRLHELSALRAGEVLNTGKAIGESVSISAAGKLVAHGELVDIEGQVGVRIVELARS
jgi:flagellar motor switch/type III secretory pathway protein FliN